MYYTDNIDSEMLRDAFPDMRRSPSLFGKQHIHSHPDFPLEDGATACPIAVDIDHEISHGRSSICQSLLADMSYTLFVLCTMIFSLLQHKVGLRQSVEAELIKKINPKHNPI